MSEQPQGIPSSSPVSPVTPAAPGAPRPITVRLKPVTKPATPVMPVKPAGDEPVALEQPAPAAAAETAPTPTVVLKPVTSAATPVAPVSPVAPVVPKPAAASPLSGVQAQAAKSKTSRITLDSAIGVAPSIPIATASEPKTIRLKRPTDLAAPAAAIQPPSVKSGTAPIRQTSRIPDAIVESAAAEASTVTQKKTLKIKRPGISVADTAASEGGDVGSSDFGGVQMTPLTDLSAVQESQGSKVFTMIAVGAAAASLVLGFALMWCLLASGVGPAAGPNNTASLGGPELFWPGRMN